MTTPERRAARAELPVRIYRLGEEPPDDWLEHTTPAERFQMVFDLSARMFEFDGRPAPAYTRASIPVRLTRLL